MTNKNQHESDKSFRHYRQARAGRLDWLVSWWGEATGPIRLNQHRSYSRAILRRIMLWIPALVLAAIVASVAGFYFFTGWRAQDLVAKATANAAEGNARTARLQIYSAMSLRPEDPAVKRAAALVESRLGNPGAVQSWEELGQDIQLAPDEIDARAETMARYGDEEQFARAVAQLEAQGDTVRVAELHSMRSLRGGDMEQAINQARAAMQSDKAPRLRLQLLRLLALRHGAFLQAAPVPAPEDADAAKEMAALVDSLVDTPCGDEALAFGLGARYFPADKKSAWAAAAWRNPSASNPALLPAADFLAISGAEPAATLYNKLNIHFIGAPLPQQAAFARWMLGRGMNEQVLVTASSSEAVQDEGIFRARVAALAALGRWDELYKLAGTPGKASEGLRLMAKAQAAGQIGKSGEESDLVRKALRSAAERGGVLEVIRLADLQGMRGEADDILLAICGKSAVAEGAFRLARERFARQGQFAKLDEAYQAASRVAPKSPVVADHRRFEDLLAGKPVDPQETAAALEADPNSGNLRLTHAFALLKADRAPDALALFDRFDVFVEALPPSQQAVAAAVLAANGRTDLASRVVRRLDINLLTPGGYALIAPLINSGS